MQSTPRTVAQFWTDVVEFNDGQVIKGGQLMTAGKFFLLWLRLHGDMIAPHDLEIARQWDDEVPLSPQFDYARHTMATSTSSRGIFLPAPPPPPPVAAETTAVTVHDPYHPVLIEDTAPVGERPRPPFTVTRTQPAKMADTLRKKHGL